MKRLKPNVSYLKTACFACLAVMLFFVSCKKDRKVTNTIMGDWYEYLPAKTVRQLNFYGDSIKFSVVNYADPKAVAITALNGTFSINNDKLQVDIKDVVVTENHKFISKTAYNGKLFENATFKVKDDLLTINYTSYPADAPVASKIEFKREQIPD